MQPKKGRKWFRLKLDEMIRSLRDDIVTGRLPVGSYLIAEKELEKKYELSNSSVRKGLDVLVHEGLIEKIPRVGNRVVNVPQEQKAVLRIAYADAQGQQVSIEDWAMEFEKLHPHIEVQCISVPHMGYSRIVEEYLEADMCDVVLLNSNNNFQDLLENEKEMLFEPLSVGEEYPSFLTKPFTVDGACLVHPLLYSPVILCYNKEHFRDRQMAEPDSSWTWDKLMEAAQELSDKNNRFGFYFYPISRNRWPIFLLQSGVRVRPDESGSYRECATQLMDGLDVCRRWFELPGVFPAVLSESESDAEALFAEGKVSIIMTTYFLMNHLRSANIDFDIAPLPSLANNHTMLLIMGLGINSKSKLKQEAKRFVEFMASNTVQLELQRNTLNLSGHQKAAGEWTGQKSIPRPSRFGMYKETMPTYRMMQDIGISNRMMRSMQRDIMLYLSGLLDREIMTARLEQILSENENT